MCVCSNANPLQYYVLRILTYADIWCYCGLFLVQVLLGQTTLCGGNVHLYFCIERSEVRVTVCVIGFVV